MTEENLNWSTSPAVTTQTVLAAKKFLDKKLAKYEHFVSTDKFISSLFEDKHGFRRAKAGVGRDTILKFLGCNWKGWTVQEALIIIKDKELDQEAILKIPTMEQAKVLPAIWHLPLPRQ